MCNYGELSALYYSHVLIIWYVMCLFDSYFGFIGYCRPGSMQGLVSLVLKIVMPSNAVSFADLFTIEDLISSFRYFRVVFVEKDGRRFVTR